MLSPYSSGVWPLRWTAYFGGNFRGKTRVEHGIFLTSPSACPPPLEYSRIWFQFGSKINLKFDHQNNKNRLKRVRRLYSKVSFYFIFILHTTLGTFKTMGPERYWYCINNGYAWKLKMIPLALYFVEILLFPSRMEDLPFWSQWVWS